MTLALALFSLKLADTVTSAGAASDTCLREADLIARQETAILEAFVECQLELALELRTKAFPTVSRQK